MKVKAVRAGYWGNVHRPEGSVFEFTGTKAQMGSWMVEVSKKEADAAGTHMPGSNRPLTPAEAGVPADAAIRAPKDDPNLVDLERIGAQAGRATPVGVSAEEAEKGREQEARLRDRADKKA